MQKLIIFAISFSLLVILSNCFKSHFCRAEPEPIIRTLFQLSQNGVTITDSTLLSSLKLSYYNNGQKVYQSVFGLLVNQSGTGPYDNKGTMYANFYDNPNNTFYIEYPGLTDRDSIKVTFTHGECANAINQIYFDNQLVDTINPPTPLGIIYKFNK
jgi:hypothetical protein